MPTYDYECRNCGHRVEVLHGVNATGPTACEQCGGPMRKLMSAPAIVFKGSGWAKKDRSAKAPVKAAATEKGDGSPSAGSESATQAEKAPTSRSTDAGSSSSSKGSSAASPAD